MPSIQQALGYRLRLSNPAGSDNRLNRLTFNSHAVSPGNPVPTFHPVVGQELSPGQRGPVGRSTTILRWPNANRERHTRQTSRP